MTIDVAPSRARSRQAAGYDFVKGWGSRETPSLVANSSDQHVRIPGNMKPHSVAVHPVADACGWPSAGAARSRATLRIEGTVQHAHPECGNGVTWSLELRRGGDAAAARGGRGAGRQGRRRSGRSRTCRCRPGDLVSLLIGPRDGNHSCDLTAVDLTLTGDGKTRGTWPPTSRPTCWPAIRTPTASATPASGTSTPSRTSGGDTDAVIPAGSLLARWQAAATAGERQRLARAGRGRC